MGAVVSGEEKDPDYWTLPRREERRYETVGFPAEVSASDVIQTADKYDFLILFRDIKVAGDDEDEEEHPDFDDEGLQGIFSRVRSASASLADLSMPLLQDSKDQRQIKCRDARKMYRDATPGSDATKDAAEKRFNEAWRSTFHKEWEDVTESSMNGESVPFHALLVLFRDLLTKTLSEKAGLQLKLSRSRQDPELICCRIRAPFAVLEQEADRLGYSLQFRPEVDPGTDFWFQGKGDEEIKEEARDLERDETNRILQKLYKAQKISANDNSIFDSEPREKKALWSRRVHTLERIADQVPCDNDYPAYAPFKQDPKRRHLFRQYPSVRGKTLFQSKDRLELTQSIIAAIIDPVVLKKSDIILDFLPLHDANQGEAISNEVLSKRWVTPWKEERRKIGAPTVSSSYAKPDRAAPLLLYWFCQPLDDIRSYFGEKVAFYYAWLGFLTMSLLWPSLVGLGCQAYYFVEGFTWCDSGIDWVQVGTAGFVALWCVVYSEMWKGQQALAATKWGTEDAEDKEEVRHEFTPVMGTARGSARRVWQGLYFELSKSLGARPGDFEEIYERNPVTNRNEPFYPSKLRAVWETMNMLIVLMCILASCGVTWALMYLEYFLVQVEGMSWGEYLVAAIVAVEIPVAAFYYNKLALRLTNGENHRTQASYDTGLIMKIFSFEFFNRFGAMLFIAFIKQYTYGCNNDCCMDFASTQLMFILGVYLLRNVMNPIDASFGISKAIVRALARCEASLTKCFCGASRRSKSKSFVFSVSHSFGLSIPPAAGAGGAAEPWETEYLREEYSGTFNSMARMVLQFGVVTSFATALPSAPCVALILNLLEMRIDARKMMHDRRRPVPEAADGIGVWLDLVDWFGFLCIVINTGLIVFSTNTFEDYSNRDKILIFLVAEYALLLVRAFLQHVIPDEPEGLSDIRERHHFLRDKHVHGFIEDDDEETADASGFAVRGVVDVEAMDLSKLVSGSGGAEGEEFVDKIRRFQADLRKVNNDLTDLKAALQDAMQFEIMNPDTGIGETLSGLPLGCINITLERIEAFNPNPIPQAANIQIVISLKSTDPEDRSAPGPPPVTSKRARPTRIRGDMEFNELFTLAPVRTHDANLYFDIMDSSTDPKRRGTCFVSLSKLADQMEHYKVIPISQRDPTNAARFIRTDAKLKVKVQFKFSKIKPIKDNLARLTAEQADLERSITKLRLGIDERETDVA